VSKPAYRKLADELRRAALAYPETYEEAPWGDRVVKVRGKIFLFCGGDAKGLHLSVKLPASHRRVLANRYAKPTPYGLGKSGWVSCAFAQGATVPVDDVHAWIDESYRALAPKKLVAQLAAPNAVAPAGGAKHGGAKAAKTTATSSARLRPGTRVLLMTGDRLRAERAERAFAGHGVTLEVAGSPAEARARVARWRSGALIIDLGREPREGLALAAEIDDSDRAIHLFLTGVRDAAQNRQARQCASSAELFRAPPGDAAVVARTLEELARHQPRARTQ
jgi:predicted DNA-binding protein (MmcQ/YjbR family)